MHRSSIVYASPKTTILFAYQKQLGSYCNYNCWMANVAFEFAYLKFRIVFNNSWNVKTILYGHCGLWNDDDKYKTNNNWLPHTLCKLYRNFKLIANTNTRTHTHSHSQGTTRRINETNSRYCNCIRSICPFASGTRLIFALLANYFQTVCKIMGEPLRARRATRGRRGETSGRQFVASWLHPANIYFIKTERQHFCWSNGRTLNCLKLQFNITYGSQATIRCQLYHLELVLAFICDVVYCFWVQLACSNGLFGSVDRLQSLVQSCAVTVSPSNASKHM